MLILDPPKERGVVTLKRGDEIWNYIPRIDRKIKIPSGMMGDAWMGSHFTYDDMVKESKIERLYRFTVKEEHGDTVVLQGIPKENAAVVWGKLEYVVEKSRLIPLLVRYYDEDGTLARTMTFSDVRRVGDRWIPFRLRVEPSHRPGEYTEVRYEKLELNVLLPRRLFSPASLGR
ncbi:MAG: outer membrane lipoprotein-sorting protein [Candidatus Hydrothermae bacterium]|nr:outer membrane lipoprotein-sorting protein [Candidatus Hydrothermae bacterium]